MLKAETKTLCGKCGAELKDAVDFSLHRRKHHIEYWYEHAPHIMAMLLDAGYKDEPDDPELRKRMGLKPKTFPDRSTY
jgi:hypothetical protein